MVNSAILWSCFSWLERFLLTVEKLKPHQFTTITNGAIDRSEPVGGTMQSRGKYCNRLQGVGEQWKARERLGSRFACGAERRKARGKLELMLGNSRQLWKARDRLREPVESVVEWLKAREILV